VDQLAAFTHSWLQSIGFIAAVYAGAMVAERILPAERGQPWRRAGFNIIAGLLLFTLSGVLVTLLHPIIAPYIQPPRGGLMRVEFPDGALGSLGQVLAFFLVYDFFYYWWHRAQHEFGWLWPQHELHHSDTALNVTTSLRHHWLEDPLRVFTLLLPFGFLFQFKPATVPWIATVAGLWPFFIHVNVRLRLGWLTPVLAGPQYHRIHHSLRPEHMNHNYAAFFPIWDIVFGTAYLPRRDEFPATGVARGEPAGLGQALAGPFIDWGRQLRRRASA
jgi:sterol desaturase/sphingolipid hydroxylase (fatty acid hydroxylase superfamily)